MIEISLNNVSKNYGFNKVLDNVNFEIKTNERVSLVGSNGCGKTTILKLISAMENVTSGTISIRKSSRIGMLSQIPDKSDLKVKDYLYQGIKEIMDLKDKLIQLEHLLVTDPSEKNLKKYGRTQEEFLAKDGYIIDEYVNKIINVFNIKKNILELNYNSLSGGEKTIIALATLILSKPDILLLDEPTNHLDIKTTEWLEQFLINYKGTVLIVSHDRYFLDKVTTKTILIERGNETIFHGNYSYYLKKQDNLIMQEFKNYKEEQKKSEAIKTSIRHLREWGKIGDNERFFKRANCMERRLEKMVKLEKPIEKKELPLSFSGSRSGKDVIKLDNINIGYDKPLLKDASLEVIYQEHVCLMGDNGCGKSTLIKYIMNNKLGTNIKIGYIPQEIRFDNDNITLLEEARNNYIGSETYLRSTLAKFMFHNENIYKKLSSLSGGEKVRLKLFCLMQKEINLLILDEPTNHIDIDTKETLENALTSYNGTILFISHDRYFINKIATRIVHFENCKLVNYIGNYDDYKLKTMV